MKKKLTTIFLIVMILLIGGVMFVPQPVHAGFWSSIGCIVTGNAACIAQLATQDLFIELLSGISYLILTLASWFVGLMGVVLNISIILTMNIKAIFDSTPAIKDVWVVIRNLSSIFIIFALLYASITTILDVGKSNVKALVGSIIMAGVLINFSLFFTKVAIDASNLVSLQLYRAIVPNSQESVLSGKDIGKNLLTASFGRGGLSDVFMSSLKVTKIYNQSKGNNGLLTPSADGTSLKIIVSTLAGAFLMIIAGLSFLAAGIAFIVRLAMLMFLMGFSPIYFVSFIFPDLKSAVGDKWLKMLTDQLIFMPVYLLFLYVALRFISTINSGDAGSIFEQMNQAQLGTKATDETGGVFLSLVGLLIQYTIAIVLINVPLIAAATMGGGDSLKWGNVASKWVGERLKKTPGQISTSIATNTAGRLASKVAENESFKNFASKTGGAGKVLLQTTRGVAKNYNEKLDKQVKNRVEYAESLGYDKDAAKPHEANIKYLNRLRARYGTKPLPKEEADKLQAIFGVNTLGAAFGVAQKRLNDVKNERKSNYSGDLKSNFSNPETLFMKIARKNKDAAKKINKSIDSDAAKVEVDILKAEIAEYKDDISAAKRKREGLEKEIKRNNGPTGNQSAELADYKKDETDALNAILKIQAQIDLIESKIIK